MSPVVNDYQTCSGCEVENDDLDECKECKRYYNALDDCYEKRGTPE